MQASATSTREYHTSYGNWPKTETGPDVTSEHLRQKNFQRLIEFEIVSRTSLRNLLIGSWFHCCT